MILFIMVRFILLFSPYSSVFFIIIKETKKDILEEKAEFTLEERAIDQDTSAYPNKQVRILLTPVVLFLHFRAKPYIFLTFFVFVFVCFVVVIVGS